MRTAITTEATLIAPVLPEIRAFIVNDFLLGNDSGFDNGESLLESGVIDSTGIMQVVAFLEERFGIIVEDDDMVADNLESVSRIAAYVERKQSLKNAA